MMRTQIFAPLVWLLTVSFTACTAPPIQDATSSASPTSSSPAAAPTTTLASGLTPAPASASSTALPAAAPPAPPVVLPFEEAIAAAAKQALDAGAATISERATVVIDPLIDGATGAQTQATQLIGQRLTRMAQTQYPMLDLQKFSGQSVSRLPMVLIGTFTPINLAGKPDGERDIYRVCFAMIDLRSGKIVSKGFARAKTDGVNHTPLALFRESPVWVADPEVMGYVRTCQGTKAGDPINPAYVDSVMAAALIEEAHQSLIAGKFRDAIALYATALKNPKGQQSRSYAGLYAANLGQKQPVEAMKAFGRLIDMGIESKRLAVQFNFSGASTGFGKESRTYDTWLREIGQRVVKSSRCMQISGHVGRSPNEAISDRLSQQRAEFVRQKLLANAKGIDKKVTAVGEGARQNLVGTGSNDEVDAFDRRIEFKPTEC